MDVGIIVMKPIAGGVMPNPAASIRWIGSQVTDVIIPGVENTSLVDENIRSIEAPLTAEDVTSLESIAKELGPVFCRRCGYCLPCPNGIPVSFISSAEIFFRRSGWHKLNSNHVEGFRNGVNCVQCGLCEQRCPYNLPLTRLVPEYSKRLLLRAEELNVK